MKQLINRDGWKVMGYNVYRVRVWRETKDFWVFMKKMAGEFTEKREEKRGVKLFWTQEEAVAEAERVLTEKVEAAKKTLEYLCREQVKVVG